MVTQIPLIPISAKIQMLVPGSSIMDYPGATTPQAFFNRAEPGTVFTYGGGYEIPELRDIAKDFGLALWHCCRGSPEVLEHGEHTARINKQRIGSSQMLLPNVLSALRIIEYMRTRERVVGAELARHLGCSASNIERLMRPLVVSGLMSSQRGSRGGGYRLRLSTANSCTLGGLAAFMYPSMSESGLAKIITEVPILSALRKSVDAASADLPEGL